MNLKALAYQLRRDTIDIICAGKAGHIGGDMSVMEVLVELYFDQMNIDAKNPEDPDAEDFLNLLNKVKEAAAAHRICIITMSL